MNPKKELITMGPMGNPDTAKPSNSEASTANRAEEPRAPRTYCDNHWGA